LLCKTSELLSNYSALRSYGDTQTDSDILEMLEQHNERGTCMDVIIAPEFTWKLMTDYTGSNTPADQRDLWRTPPAPSLP
jgi:hypothetical protein